MGFFQDLRTGEKTQHLQVGRPATATITALHQAGTSVSEDPEVETGLEVSRRAAVSPRPPWSGSGP